MKIKVSMIVLLYLIILFSFNQEVFAENKNIIASGDCGENITWKIDADGLLTLNGTGAMNTKSKSPWVDYQDKVKSVSISEGITSIAEFSFDGNNNIESIELPSTVERIGVRAFAECSRLKQVKFPKDMARILEAAFYNCISLEEVIIPKTSILYINDYSFKGCNSLKKVSVDCSLCNIADSENVFEKSTILCGYEYSSVFYYARFYGLEFENMATGEKTKTTITNKSFLENLPKTNVKALGVTSHGTRSYSGEILTGFSTSFCNEKDESNETYKKIKSKVDELTINCTTEREKAFEIYKWVALNMTYKYGLGGSANTSVVYRYYENLAGNCEAYTMLTNYMLYLCNIPTATVSNLTHEWSAAYVDGEWIYIDSTHYRFDSTDSQANLVSFAYDGLVYVEPDPLKGPFIAGIADNSVSINKLATYTIPYNSVTKGIFENTFYGVTELRASLLDRYSKEYIQKYKSCAGEHNGQIIGKNTHNYITTTQDMGNGKYAQITACDNCGDVKSKSDISILIGDINNDGKVNGKDWNMMYEYINETIQLSNEQLKAGDVNKDGKVNGKDWNRLYEHINEINPLF